MDFHIEADVEKQMSEICKELGMSTTDAFNIFTKAFIRAKGMPFSVAIDQPKTELLATESLLSSADVILDKYSNVYRRLAE